MIVGHLLNSKTAISVARETAKIKRQNKIDRRVWDLRRVGYSVVLAKLGVVSDYADWRDDGFHGPLANPQAFFQSDACRTYNERMGATCAKCREGGIR